MEPMTTFQDFLTTQIPHIDLGTFAVDLALTTILILILGVVYTRYGSALSLGLLGALSIVRFRTPIKESEELAYLFLNIAIGLGLGAGYTGIGSMEKIAKPALVG